MSMEPCEKCCANNENQKQSCEICAINKELQNFRIKEPPGPRTRRVIGLDTRVLPLRKEFEEAANPCAVCTYHNPAEARQCQMCCSDLTSLKAGKFRPVGTVRFKHKMRFQMSVISEELRRTENTEALKLYDHIISHCEKVLQILQYLNNSYIEFDVINKVATFFHVCFTPLLSSKSYSPSDDGTKYHFTSICTVQHVSVHVYLSGLGCTLRYDSNVRIGIIIISLPICCYIM